MRGGGGVCRGAPSRTGGSSLHSPPHTCFFTFANESICMAEKEEAMEIGKMMILEKR